MSQDSNDLSKMLGNLGFVDQVVEGIRKVGESLKVQELLDDAMYMSGKVALEAILSTAMKFTIEGKPDLTANRGVMFATIAENPVDILLMTQVAPKKMAFIIDKEQNDVPILKSLFKSFGVVADIDEMINGEKDVDILNWIRRDRKMLAVIVPGNLDPSKIDKAFEKILRLSRDGFCPIIPLGLNGTSNLKPGASIIMKLGEKSGLNQTTKDDDIPAMAKDFIDKIHGLKA